MFVSNLNLVIILYNGWGGLSFHRDNDFLPPIAGSLNQPVERQPRLLQVVGWLFRAGDNFVSWSSVWASRFSALLLKPVSEGVASLLLRQRQRMKWKKKIKRLFHPYLRWGLVRSKQILQFLTIIGHPIMFRHDYFNHISPHNK